MIIKCKKYNAFQLQKIGLKIHGTEFEWKTKLNISQMAPVKKVEHKN